MVKIEEVLKIVNEEKENRTHPQEKMFPARYHRSGGGQHMDAVPGHRGRRLLGISKEEANDLERCRSSRSCQYDCKDTPQ